MIQFEDLPKVVGKIYDIVSNQSKSENSDYGKTYQEEEWFDLEALCKYDPRKPAKATVYGWVSNGLIPYYKRGKRLYFSKIEIDAWLRSGRVMSTQELANSALLCQSNKKAGQR
jgi:hypothetical protein